MPLPQYLPPPPAYGPAGFPYYDANGNLQYYNTSARAYLTNTSAQFSFPQPGSFDNNFGDYCENWEILLLHALFFSEIQPPENFIARATTGGGVLQVP